MAGRGFVLALVLSMALVHAHGAVYKVGDSAGWTTIGSPDYKQWAVAKTFQLGDVVHFEYNPQFHNVMRVAHAMYRACNATAPLATYTTGNDSITITTRGHHYFICGVNGHCQSGQKVDINVIAATIATPSSSPVAAPNLPSAQSPGPSTNSAHSSMAPIAQALLLALAILSRLGFA